MRALAIALAGCLVGCSGLAPQINPRISPDLNVAAMADTSRFERELQRPPRVDEPSARARKITPPVFWTATALAIAGGVGAIAFGATGIALNRKVENGYDEGLTRDDERKYLELGETMNNLTIATGVVGLVGLGVAAIVYGVDWSRCGALAPARRGCPARP